MVRGEQGRVRTDALQRKPQIDAKFFLSEPRVRLGSCSRENVQEEGVWGLDFNIPPRRNRLDLRLLIK